MIGKYVKIFKDNHRGSLFWITCNINPNSCTEKLNNI